MQYAGIIHELYGVQPRSLESPSPPAEPGTIGAACPIIGKATMACRLQGRKCTATRAWEALDNQWREWRESAKKGKRVREAQSRLVPQKRHTSFLSLSGLQVQPIISSLFKVCVPAGYFDRDGVQTRAFAGSDMRMKGECECRFKASTLEPSFEFGSNFWSENMTNFNTTESI